MPNRLWLILLLALGACDDPQTDAHSATAPESNYQPTAVELQPAELAQKMTGTATLLSPDALAQLNADIRSAEVSANFSHRAFIRYRDTKSLPEHFVDNAERQASTDATQLALVQLRLRNTWGDTAPFLAAEARQKLVDELSSGKTTLVRLDFPRSVERDPKNVRVAPLGGGGETELTTLWAAPSGNLAMPGTSFFGLMPTGPGLRPGDRAKVTAESSSQLSGVVIPASAVVVYEGASWCYVEKEPGEFERKQVSLATPVDDGYLVKDFEPGTKVAVRGASVLLSREAEPATGDDDDGGAAKPAEKSEKGAEKTEKSHIAPVAKADDD